MKRNAPDAHQEDDEYEYVYYKPKNYLSIFLAFVIPLIIISLIAGGIIYDFYANKPSVPFTTIFPKEPTRTKIKNSHDYKFEYISKGGDVKYIVYIKRLPYPYLSLFYNQKKKLEIIDDLNTDDLLKMARLDRKNPKVIFTDLLQRNNYLCQELKIQTNGFLWCRTYYWRGDYIILSVTAKNEDLVSNNRDVAKFFNNLRFN